MTKAAKISAKQQQMWTIRLKLPAIERIRFEAQVFVFVSLCFYLHWFRNIVGACNFAFSLLLELLMILVFAFHRTTGIFQWEKVPPLACEFPIFVPVFLLYSCDGFSSRRSQKHLDLNSKVLVISSVGASIKFVYFGIPCQLDAKRYLILASHSRISRKK